MSGGIHGCGEIGPYGGGKGGTKLDGNVGGSGVGPPRRPRAGCMDHPRVWVLSAGFGAVSSGPSHPFVVEEDAVDIDAGITVEGEKQCPGWLEADTAGLGGKRGLERKEWKGLLRRRGKNDRVETSRSGGWALRAGSILGHVGGNAHEAVCVLRDSTHGGSGADLEPRREVAAEGAHTRDTHVAGGAVCLCPYHAALGGCEPWVPLRGDGAGLPIRGPGTQGLASGGEVLGAVVERVSFPSRARRASPGAAPPIEDHYIYLGLGQVSSSGEPAHAGPDDGYTAPRLFVWSISCHWLILPGRGLLVNMIH